MACLLVDASRRYERAPSAGRAVVPDRRCRADGRAVRGDASHPGGWRAQLDRLLPPCSAHPFV